MLALPVIAGATSSEAWEALKRLDIATAKTHFEAALEESPDDLAVMRGLLLTAYFDLDVPLQAKMIQKMIKTDPANPYLLPVFEFMAEELGDWKDQNKLHAEIGQALSRHGRGALAYSGKFIQAGAYYKCGQDKGAKMMAAAGCAPGCWTVGPFENKSQIAAYRPLPGETAPLDTAAQFRGKMGTVAGWSWIPNVYLGDLVPVQAMKNSEDMACQARLFFELPEDMEVVIGLGGVFHYRMYLDGLKIHDDPVFRNANEREAFQVKLSRGAHELALVMGAEETVIFSVLVVDQDYNPIPKLKWLRQARITPADSLQVHKVHPIFDPFDAHVAVQGEAPDTRLWHSILRMYNGFAHEVMKDLESLHQKGELNLLEQWALYSSYKTLEEEMLAGEVLRNFHENAPTPWSELRWIQLESESSSPSAEHYINLQQKYRDRYAIDAMAAVVPALSADVETTIRQLNQVAEKYPWCASVHALLFIFYADALKDYDKAIREARVIHEMTGDRSILDKVEFSLFLLQGRVDQAIKNKWKNLRAAHGLDVPIGEMAELTRQLNRSAEFIPYLDSLKQCYPYNLENYPLLQAAYLQLGQQSKAQAVSLELHRLDPSDVRPYILNDSLRHYATFDSIFGAVDVASLWGETPPQNELGGKTFYFLLDRQQVLLFDSGVWLQDVHSIRVLLDQDAVQLMQSMQLDFDPDTDESSELITARRLRKNGSPLAATREGQELAFKDLKPGDAIELHFRTWGGQSGDLWNDYWVDYQTGSTYFQRRWEFSILTNRADLQYRSIPPAPEATVSDRCGFRKYTWQEDNTPAVLLNVHSTPPSRDLLGSVVVSTLQDWEQLNQWYHSISKAVLGDNPRARTLARQLTAGDSTDDQKLASLYRHIVNTIPYQVIPLDYDGSIPHRPDEVLSNRWGDCKDKGHLLIQMLREVGIEAWPVLVSSRFSGTQLPLPAFSFNHLMVACRIHGDTIYVDASDKGFAPRKSVNRYYSGQPCLVVGPTPASLSRIPIVQPEDYYKVSRITLKPQQGSNFSLYNHKQYYNLSAGDVRIEYIGCSYEDILKDLVTDVTGHWQTKIVLDTLIYDSLETIDTVFAETWQGSLELNRQSAANITLLHLPKWGVMSSENIPYLESEDEDPLPVDLTNWVTRTDRILELEVPLEYGRLHLPEEVHLGGGLYAFDLVPQWNVQTRILTMTSNLTIRSGICDRGEFIAFIRQVDEVFNSALVFEK